MLRRFLPVLLCGALLRLAAQDCADPGIRISHEQRGNLVHLYAEAINCREATVTVSADLTNMRARPALPATFELHGKQRVELGVLSPAGEGKWSYRYRYDWLPGSPTATPDNTGYALPFPANARRKLVQGYRGRFSHHAGGNDEHALDWDLPSGTPVLAARGGVVIAIRQDSNRGGPDLRFKNCANYIMVQHADGTCGEYAHLQPDGARVTLGQRVTTGQTLGLSGNTGYSSLPHLHFAVFRTVDGRTRETLPVKILDRQGQPLRLVEGQSY